MLGTVMNRLFLSLGLAACFVGCNGSNLVVVKGKVTYNDKPVTSGTISFLSQDYPSAYGD